MDKVSQAFEISQTDASIAKCKLSAQWLEGSPARVEKISRALQGSNQIEILELTASFTHGSHPGRLRVSAIRGRCHGRRLPGRPSHSSGLTKSSRNRKMRRPQISDMLIRL